MVRLLPLYKLFLTLRNEGFSLGTEQYLLLIKALQERKNLEDLDAIRRTCKIIWTNSLEEAFIFDRHFDFMIFNLQKVAEEVEKVLDSEREKTSETKTPELEAEEKTEPTERPSPEPTDPEVKKESPDLLPSTSPDPAMPEDAGLPLGFDPMEMIHKKFLLMGDPSPITLRQMQQSWRYLRHWRREGPKVELDLDQTIQDIGNKGFFLDTAKSAPRINIIELLLLIDRNGSMLPFHAFVEDLERSALHGGRFDKAKSLYFHDYPTQFLYRQPQLIEEISLTKLKDHLHKKRTVVMIVSDAGAARQTYSSKRVERSKKLIELLKEYSARQVWVNPIPRDRWQGCSAEDIIEFIPMFEMNRAGLDAAIDVLRGKLSGKMGSR